jgi:hypothetical protein
MAGAYLGCDPEHFLKILKGGSQQGVVPLDIHNDILHKLQMIYVCHWDSTQVTLDTPFSRIGEGTMT